ncbi:TfoX/Sxy family protein [Kaarinaea lacus]
MASTNEFAEFILEMLELFGSVRAKRMFGGFGLYLDDTMFALIADDTLYFKVDEHSRAEFESLGMQAFRYAKNGKEYKMSYYGAPEDALENPEELSRFAQLGYDAALRCSREKKQIA